MIVTYRCCVECFDSCLLRGKMLLIVQCKRGAGLTRGRVSPGFHNMPPICLCRMGDGHW